jgi:hypothetical protein
MLLSSYNCSLIWENMASSLLTLALQNSSNSLCTPRWRRFSLIDIVDAATNSKKILKVKAVVNRQKSFKNQTSTWTADLAT